MPAVEKQDAITEDFIRDMTEQAVNQPIEYDSEMYKYFQNLVKTDTIPPKVKGEFWAFSDKEAVLTNLNQTEIRKILMDFDINYLMMLMSKSEGDFTFDDMANIEQAKAHLNIRLHRSLDGFERKMESTQIREVTMSRQGTGESVLGNFFGLFKKKREM